MFKVINWTNSRKPFELFALSPSVQGCRTESSRAIGLEPPALSLHTKRLKLHKLVRDQDEGFHLANPSNNTDHTKPGIRQVLYLSLIQGLPSSCTFTDRLDSSWYSFGFVEASLNPQDLGKCLKSSSQVTAPEWTSFQKALWSPREESPYCPHDAKLCHP